MCMSLLSFLKNKNSSVIGKILFKALLCSFVVCSLMSMTSFSAQSESISESVLRLHIMANSDSEKDQELKLNVRDLVQNICYNMYNRTVTLDEAERIVSQNLETIRETVQNEVYRQGFNYNVNAEIVNMYFTNRVYENITLPAGYYDAVRITLGEGKGHNWWCVMFPPICISTSENTADISDVLSCEQTDIVTNKSYDCKFKIYEMFCDISEKINGK